MNNGNSFMRPGSSVWGRCRPQCTSDAQWFSTSVHWTQVQFLNQQATSACAHVSTSFLNHKVMTLFVFVFLQNRRWSPAQAREFLHLHSALALITLHSDISSQRTHGDTLFFFLNHTFSNSNSPVLRVFCGVWLFVAFSLCVASGDFKLQASNFSSSTSLLPLHNDVLTSLFTPEGQPYLLEVNYR